MNRTFSTEQISNFTFNFLTLPNTDLFEIEIINTLGADIERTIENKHNKTLYGGTHLVEHLSFRQTKDYSTKKLATLLKRYGKYNASTSFDFLNFWFKTTSKNIDIAVKLVCNIAFNDLQKLTKKEFETEKDIVLNEIKRYTDDTQTLFLLNTTASACGYKKEDNVLGSTKTVKKLTLQNVKKLKSSLMKNGSYVFNIIYDPNKLTNSKIIDIVLKETERFNWAETDNRSSYDISTNNIIQSMKSPKPSVTNILKQNSKQSLTMLLFKQESNVFAANVGNMYLTDLAEKSLNDVIRGDNGLTYDIGVSTELINNNRYSTIFCDVSAGNEKKLMELIKSTINQLGTTYNKSKHRTLLETITLIQTLKYINQQRYDVLFGHAIYNPEILKEYEHQLLYDVDLALRMIYNELSKYEKVKGYLMQMSNAIKQETFSAVINY